MDITVSVGTMSQEIGTWADIEREMIKLNKKYTYVQGTRFLDHGARNYDVAGQRLPSVTTILGRTKDQKFLQDCKIGQTKAARKQA